MTDSGLPEGWTLDRVRAAVRGAYVEIVRTTLPVVDVSYPDGAFAPPRVEPLDPAVILDFGGKVLVRPVGSDAWYMGEEADGRIECWGCYGDDLGVAIDSL